MKHGQSPIAYTYGSMTEKCDVKSRERERDGENRDLYSPLFFVEQVWSSIGSFYCLLALCDYICSTIS